VRTALVAAIAVAVGFAAGCTTDTEEERTWSDARAEFIDGLDRLVVQAGVSDSLHEVGGPCNSLSDDYQVLQKVLSEDDLFELCCETRVYEVEPSDLSVIDGGVWIAARATELVECD
jgi:hypothetical protein